MPTYQYRCRECGHDLEVVQSFSDDPLTTCPRCEGSLRKIFSAVAISFKGSGFYKTDSRASSSSSQSSSASTPSSSNGDSGNGTGGSAGNGTGDSSSAPASSEPAPAKAAEATAAAS